MCSFFIITNTQRAAVFSKCLKNASTVLHRNIKHKDEADFYLEPTSALFVLLEAAVWICKSTICAMYNTQNSVRCRGSHRPMGNTEGSLPGVCAGNRFLLSSFQVTRRGKNPAKERKHQRTFLSSRWWKPSRVCACVCVSDWQRLNAHLVEDDVMSELQLSEFYLKIQAPPPSEHFWQYTLNLASHDHRCVSLTLEFVLKVFFIRC